MANNLLFKNTINKPTLDDRALLDLNRTPEDQTSPNSEVKRPPWLPANWTIELKKRSAGRSAGNIDKYYFDPSGLKFRSKNEVLHFLATGNRLKRKSNSDAETMSCEGPGSHKEKRTSSKRKTSEALSSDSRV
ncbi:Methyl-CpG-binding domain-containing protein 5 [Abeliophyllum distichum]|uniref:Methyl-CpG-binding domain-containing protein 5 n=1 Tax=Abeliophyllum distichum TaxID=126358 RepID=A0ABD1TH17_9LAMI